MTYDERVEAKNEAARRYGAAKAAHEETRRALEKARADYEDAKHELYFSAPIGPVEAHEEIRRALGLPPSAKWSELVFRVKRLVIESCAVAVAGDPNDGKHGCGG